MGHGSNKYRDGEKEYEHLVSERRRRDAKEEVASWQALRLYQQADRIDEARAWFVRFAGNNPGIDDVKRGTVIRHVKTLLQVVPE